MAIGLAVAVGVAQPPDAVAIEDVNLLVADRQRERFVQPGREPPPLDDAVSDRRPRTIQTSPSSVTQAPVPSARNWMSLDPHARFHGFGSGNGTSSTTYASVDADR